MAVVRAHHLLGLSVALLGVVGAVDLDRIERGVQQEDPCGSWLRMWNDVLDPAKRGPITGSATKQSVSPCSVATIACLARANGAL
ncbi:MAG: hypothetical protein J2P57_01335 [Acidimicrobiaceae bacterium]|nr:hypothetical protein [Acidimicrobiaceae bacterium]